VCCICEAAAASSAEGNSALLCQSCADVGQQGAQKNGVKKNVSICGDEGPQLGVVGGDVAVAERRRIQ
jgi:hypothetical protein